VLLIICQSFPIFKSYSRPKPQTAMTKNVMSLPLTQIHGEIYNIFPPRRIQFKLPDMMNLEQREICVLKPFLQLSPFVSDSCCNSCK
jgi:hypothetical protein